MNQKDYKEIAKIIKGEMEEISNSSMKNIDKNVARASPRVIVCQLANYFEKEGSKAKINPTFFNRKQFLKDCGIEK